VKALYIPLGVLAALLGLSLWTGWYVEARTSTWTSLLEAVGQAAEAGDWEDTRQQLDRAYAAWQKDQTFFHTILEHQELDEAEALFVEAQAAGEDENGEDFGPLLARLIKQLQLLSETQRVDIKNIL